LGWLILIVWFVIGSDILVLLIHRIIGDVGNWLLLVL